MKLQKFNRTLLGAMAISGVMGIASQAHALSVTPSFTPQYLENTITSALNAADVTSIATANFGFTGTLALAYKQDYGAGESGNAAPYYSTSFAAELSPGDGPSAGAITWNGPLGIACPSCYMVVKDGSNVPKQYVFDISGWNGTDTINFSGFWANTNGAISHVAIFNNLDPSGGGGGSLVPEPETYAMLLAGLGLVGFAARRKLS